VMVTRISSMVSLSIFICGQYLMI